MSRQILVRLKSVWKRERWRGVFRSTMLFFAFAIAFYKITFSYLDLSTLKDQVSLDLPSVFVFLLFFYFAFAKNTANF